MSLPISRDQHHRSVLGIKTLKPKLPTTGLAKALPPEVGVDAMRRAMASPQAQEWSPQHSKVATLPALVQMPKAKQLFVLHPAYSAHRWARTRSTRIFSWPSTTSNLKTYAFTWVVTLSTASCSGSGGNGGGGGGGDGTAHCER